MTSPFSALLVEDSDDDALLVHRLIEAGSLHVDLTVIRDGEVALDHLLDKAIRDPAGLPQVVLLDLSLPKVGGIEILRRMKRESLLADIPVIILSGSEREDDIRAGQTLRAHTHIAKPMSAGEFGWIVRSIGNYWPRLERLRALDIFLKDLNSSLA